MADTEIRAANVASGRKGRPAMAWFQGPTLDETPRSDGNRAVELTSPRTRRRTAGANATDPTQGGRPDMYRIRIKTFAITAIALLSAPATAFGASSDDGYSPPGGEPQLAFTGRDLYLWAGLGLLVVGLGLRRLTAPSAKAGDRELAPEENGAYGSTETAGPDPMHVPASVGSREPAGTIPAAVTLGDVEPTVAAVVPEDAAPNEPLPPRRERASQREAVPAVPVVRPR